MARAPKAQAGLTLVELTVVMLIVAALAVTAIPTMTGDSSAAAFDRAVKRLGQELQRARIAAVSRREDHAIRLTDDKNFTVDVAVPGSTNYALLRRIRLPQGVRFVGARTCAGVPSAASCGSAGAQLPAAVRFSGTSDLAVCVGGSCPSLGASSATIFVETTDHRRKARFVIYRGTGYVRQYDR